MAPLTTRRQLIGLRTPDPGIVINPRSSWAIDRPPKGPMEGEDVRFLIVHHSASHNGHTGSDTAGILQEFYDYHTSGERSWNDIAYNFLIDADGGIWEGRAGSIDGPVAGDATGGNQGFTQLVCIIGDYSEADPTPASLSSLVSLLAWLADRYDISTAPAAAVTFTSRGSNLHPSGKRVTTPTITGHRTMSQTSCPGDNLNAYVTGGLTRDVAAARIESLPTTSTTSASTSTSMAVPPSTTTAPLAVEDLPKGVAVPSGMLTTVSTVLLTGAGLLAWRWRRMRKADRG